MMFPKIVAEMAIKKMPINVLCKEIGICSKTLGDKLRGRKEFTRKEMFAIKAALDSKLPLDELFEWVE